MISKEEILNNFPLDEDIGPPLEYQYVRGPESAKG
jgi:hypothetical protein